MYRWVEDIAPDNKSASPQSDITAEEGETIIFHTKNGRRPPAGFGFIIQAGGNSTCNFYLFPNFVFLFYIYISLS